MLAVLCLELMTTTDALYLERNFLHVESVSGGLFRSTFTSIKAIRYRWKSIYKNLLQFLTTNAHPGIVNIFSGTIPFPGERL